MIQVGAKVHVPMPYRAWLDAGGGIVVVVVVAPDGQRMHARLTAQGAESDALRLIARDSEGRN